MDIQFRGHEGILAEKYKEPIRFFFQKLYEETAQICEQEISPHIKRNFSFSSSTSLILYSNNLLIGWIIREYFEAMKDDDPEPNFGTRILVSFDCYNRWEALLSPFTFRIIIELEEFDLVKSFEIDLLEHNNYEEFFQECLKASIESIRNCIDVIIYDLNNYYKVTKENEIHTEEYLKEEKENNDTCNNHIFLSIGNRDSIKERAFSPFIKVSQYYSNVAVDVPKAEYPEFLCRFGIDYDMNLTPSSTDGLVTWSNVKTAKKMVKSHSKFLVLAVKDLLKLGFVIIQGTVEDQWYVKVRCPDLMKDWIKTKELLPKEQNTLYHSHSHPITYLLRSGCVKDLFSLDSNYTINK